MKIEFFTSRTAGRNAAKIAGVKLIDNGVESAPGKRWSIQIESVTPAKSAPGKPSAPIILPPAETVSPVSDPVVEVSAEVITVLHSPRHPAGRRYPFASRSSQITGLHGKKIPVEWRKRHTVPTIV